MEATLRETWNVDPLTAGRQLYSTVANGHRPSWAVGVLETCSKRVASVPSAVQHVIEIAHDYSSWKRGHDAFSEVRALTLEAENRMWLFRMNKVTHRLLYVAENAAKVIYNASIPIDPFDEDAGAWLVRCAYEFADSLGDQKLIEALWNQMIMHTDCGS